MTDVIVGPRQNGKTTELIRLSAERDEYIIVSTLDMAQIVARQARDMGLRIPYPVAFSQLPCQSRFIGEVLVDESQRILEQVIGKPVDVMAVHGSLREANHAIPGDVTSWRKLVDE
jgi:hypothetical protein